MNELHMYAHVYNIQIYTHTAVLPIAYRIRDCRAALSMHPGEGLWLREHPHRRSQ